MTDFEIEIRPLSTETELQAATGLIQCSLAPEWRFGGHAIEKTLGDALLAFDRGELIGAVALDHGFRGAINVVAVRSEARHLGVGSALVTAACNELRLRGASTIAAAGGGPYLWPGIPANIPGALAFFEANGWERDMDVYDLTRSLSDFVMPSAVTELAAGTGITFGPATADERDWLAAHAVEHWYPTWDELYAAAAPEDILVGRARDGRLAAALIVGFPGQPENWQPLLGPGVTTIGCVGTLRESRGQGIGTALVAAASDMLRSAGGTVCHIGWTNLLTFYGRLGYTPWRAYVMASKRLGTDSKVD